MELKDLDPRNWLKKGSSAAVMDPPPVATPPWPQIMSSGGDVPPPGITAVANAENHEPAPSTLATMTAADAEKAVPPTTGLVSKEEIINTKVLEGTKTPSNN